MGNMSNLLCSVYKNFEIRNRKKMTKSADESDLSHIGKIIVFNREVKSKSGKGVVKQIYKQTVN